jgi:hypothetical protein
MRSAARPFAGGDGGRKRAWPQRTPLGASISVVCLFVWVVHRCETKKSATRCGRKNAHCFVFSLDIRSAPPQPSIQVKAGINPIRPLSRARRANKPSKIRDVSAAFLRLCHGILPT